MQRAFTSIRTARALGLLSLMLFASAAAAQTAPSPASAATSATAVLPEGVWTPLWNGKDLSGWETYLGTPNAKAAPDYPGLEKNAAGAYAKRAGNDGDPLRVFSIVRFAEKPPQSSGRILGTLKEDPDRPGQTRDSNGNAVRRAGKPGDPLYDVAIVDVADKPAIRVTGQVFGTLKTKAEYSDYRLRLQVKWGEKQYDPMIGRRRDTGLLFHCNGEYGFDGNEKNWLPCFELQIQEKDFGDLFAMQVKATANATTGTVTTGSAAVPNGQGTGWIYNPAGKPVVFLQARPIGNRLAHAVDAEKPHGEWNDIELIACKDEAIYIVNGKTVNRIGGLKDKNDAPKTSGKIALQCEGSEVFFRNIEIMPIKTVPAEFAVSAATK